MRRKHSLSVEYSTSIYDSEGRLLPDSPLNQIRALESLFEHISGVGRLLELVDEEKLERMTTNARGLMLENLGSLCTSIGEGGFHVLLQQEWPSVFGLEDQSENEQEPSEKAEPADKAAASA